MMKVRGKKPIIRHTRNRQIVDLSGLDNEQKLLLFDAIEEACWRENGGRDSIYETMAEPHDSSKPTDGNDSKLWKAHRRQCLDSST